MKTLLKLVFGLITLLALLIPLVFFLTSGMVRQTNDFFKAVQANDMSNAESFLSQAFLEETSLEELNVFLDQTGLKDFERASWPNRSFENNLGEISGTITTSKDSFPMTIKFIKENGKWKLLNINVPASGSSQAHSQTVNS